MKLVTLECPNCSAKLTINPELKQATCNYCGNQFLLDDGTVRVVFDSESAYKAGYRFEQGKSIAAKDNTQRTINSLKRAQKAAKTAYDLRRKFEQLSSSADQYETMLRRKTSVIHRIIFLFWTVLTSVAIPTFCLSAFGGRLDRRAQIAILAVCFVVILFGIYFIRQKLTNIQKSKLASLVGEKAALFNELVSAENDPDLFRIPETYRDIDTITHLLALMLDKRATTMQEAIGIFEQKKVNEELLQINNEKLKLQKKQLELQKAQLANERSRIEKEEQLVAEERESSKDLRNGLITGAVIIGTSIWLNRKKPK